MNDITVTLTLTDIETITSWYGVVCGEGMEDNNDTRVMEKFEKASETILMEDRKDAGYQV